MAGCKGVKDMKLEIKNLSVLYTSNHEKTKAVDDSSIFLRKGDSVGIVGESGSGKTSLANSILGLLPKNTNTNGEIFFEGENILKYSESQYNEIRFKKIAMVFQNSKDVLNPLLSIGEQIQETLKRHTNLNPNEINSKVEQLLIKVGLDKNVKNLYPNELSGGMRQKVLIAMAISCEPEVLILDEPTSSLDMISKKEIINLIKELKLERNLSLIVISHELDTIKELSSTIYVMYKGRIMEKGPTTEVLLEPLHMYTKGLIYSSPSVNPYGDLWGIPMANSDELIAGCPFSSRCNQREDSCFEIKPTLITVKEDREVACNQGGIIKILEGQNLKKVYKTKNGPVIGCEDCNIVIKSGEIVGIIGASGSGKTTLAGMLSGIISKDQGKVIFCDTLQNKNNFTRIKEGIQLVFQDPYTSINGNFTVLKAIAEPLVLINKESDKNILVKVKEVLNMVQLESHEDFLEKPCYALSGGQLQRVALARSLVVNPKVLIADEITSMLDPSTQANILRLLKSLQNQKGFSVVYITHDLAVARKISDRIYVMNSGKVVEEGPTEKIFQNPETNYTRKLISL
ncbi:MAG: ABC transporter ATP-binding protein [Tissierellia bacterium]|nr:ABC transporter ATP-binding protein [Tissierellia bacterium]